jgi:alkylated DNA repair dioxygenase AlkB
MSQLTLFESVETVLADDERGRIVYCPRVVNGEESDAWFRELRSGVAWRAQRRTMYEREVEVPRLIASFRLDAVRESLPAAIRDGARRVFDRLGVPFNSVGLNLYRDGRDSVAPHNDHLDELVAGLPIALLSLGATRRMTLRTKQPPAKTIHIDLEAGSLLVMSYATQLHYTHGVPKTAAPAGARISMAFRVKPDVKAANNY